MTRIGLLSDTHSSLPDGFENFFKNCHQIWHAGDIGNVAVIAQLQLVAPVKAVYGNIDDHILRRMFPLFQSFKCEEVRVLMTHIGGRPSRYNEAALSAIRNESPTIFICGHSHILSVRYDQENNLLFINPGAAGKFGSHLKTTMMRFIIEADRIKDLEIWEKDR